MNLKENILLLKSIAKKISSKLHCDRHGSCVHFAEIFVEEVNEQYPELLNDFDVIEGYVNVKFGDGIPQEHTWIRLKNDDIIDPTFLQFNKYDNNAEYSKKRTKVYSGQEYYDGGKEGSWFSERREKLPSTVFKEEKRESIRRILKEERNISDIIKIAAKEYNCSTWEINNGYCEDFALNVLEKLGGYEDNLFELSGDMFFNQRDPEFAKENWGDVIETNYGVWSKNLLDYWGYPPNVNLNLVDDEINHVWLFYNGKHYDAEVPEGVDNWFEIPLIKRLFNRYKKNMVQESIRRILKEETNIKPVLHDLLNMLFEGFDDIYYDWAEYNCGMGVCCDPYAVGFVLPKNDYNDYLFLLVDDNNYDNNGDYPKEISDELPEVCYEQPDMTNPNFNTIIFYRIFSEDIENYLGDEENWEFDLMDIINEKFGCDAQRIIFL